MSSSSQASTNSRASTVPVQHTTRTVPQRLAVSQRPAVPQRSAETDKDREIRKQKEKFLMFTRVLIKYLEQKDPDLHRKAKLVIKDCAERNKRQEKGFESVTAAMKTHLKPLVGDSYWQRADAYLKHFLEQRRKSLANQQAQGSSAQPSSSQARTLGNSSTQQIQSQRVAQSSHNRPATSTPPNASSFQQQQQQIAKQQQQQQQRMATASTAKLATSAAPSGKGKASSKKKSTAKRGSGSTTPTGGSRETQASGDATPKTSTPAAQPEQLADAAKPPPREYSELMSLIEHAVDYDWTSAGLLLGSDDLQLSAEQRNLLYGETTPEVTPKPTIGARPGWDKRNVLSARGAWARIRLQEQGNHPRTVPVVGGGLLTLPGAPQASIGNEEIPTSWKNEEIAEQDVVLAMLSEGLQIYLKTVLEKGVHSARQRQNLDGVRLWHQQHSSSAGTEKPALYLQLGCDVTRQLAQAAGSAAMTNKRMEEALERQSGVPSPARDLKDETLHEATSMGDLALKPILAKGVENAEHQGKRCFEIFGGKDELEPPFGRVPKQAKLEVVDLLMGSNISESVGRHRAETASTSIYF